ncbi:MAG: aldehyde dehydrogenase family protein [Niameybacter sp.]|uniref:aldehyde dehydrogenase family protein n=1 Tax=Niameybacter sp. TaxID=2033640 RepID=UPI002FC9CBC8
MKDMTEQIQYMHRFFKTGKTTSLDFRLYFLKKLKRILLTHQEEIAKALYLDFKKPYYETYMTEIYMVLQELEHTLKSLACWSKPETFGASFPVLKGKTTVTRKPYGLCAIFSPYNYPIQLALSPLIGAIAAGNCVVLKVSEYTPHTSKFLKRLLADVFPSHLVWTVQGDGAFCESLLNQPLDYIFFTGSTQTGKQVMAQAAKHLIPVTLELGGKNPVIVDYSADLKLAAKRIAWGKFMNAGQTCVAPDYVLVHENVVEPFLELLKAETIRMFSDKANLSRLVNERHYVRVLKCMNEDAIYYGGHFDAEDFYVEPTILYPIKPRDECMQEEIFGPILPVITFNTLESAIETVQRFPKPLACYLFGEDQLRIQHFLRNLSFGGGCVNDTIMHLTHTQAPFGGVGYSGLGAYHGKYSFDTFSRPQTICYSSKLELPLRYPPYAHTLPLVQTYINKRFKR